MNLPEVIPKKSSMAGLPRRPGSIHSATPGGRFVIEAERSQDTMVDAQRRTFAARRPMHA